MKLRTRLSNKMISVLLGLEEAQIQRSITSVRKALFNDFVPLHLGFEHIFTMSSAEVTRLRLLQSCLGLTLVMPLQSSMAPTYISRRARITVSKEDHTACTRIGLC